MTRRFFTVFLFFFFTITSFCGGEIFTINPFSPLELPKYFREEYYYLRQHFDENLPSFSPLEIMDRITARKEKYGPYNHLGVLYVRFKELVKPSCSSFFFSSSNQFREKYFFDVAFDGAVEFSERNEKKFFYASNVMLRYKELGFVSFSLNKKEEEKNMQAYSYTSSFATQFPLPFFSEWIFIAKIKSYIATRRAGNKPCSSVSTFSLKTNKTRFFNRRFFDSSYDEYFRFLFNTEGVNRCDDYRLSQLIFRRDEFFFSFKPEYVIETSTNFKIIGKVNFILPRYKSGKDKDPAWETLSVYPGIDIEYKKNEKIIFFFRTNNGCSFYDNFYYFYDSDNNKICATEGLPYDRLNMEVGLSRIYNSNFKYSLSLPIHWKQNVERNISNGEQRVKVNEDFVFFISPFFSFDLSLCRRKVVVFFKNSMNIKIPSKEKIISKYIPFNDLSFKMTCRFRTNHTIFFSLQCKTFFKISKSKHIFSLFFEYNYYLSESLLFFIRVNNIEGLLFDNPFVEIFKGIFPKDQFGQKNDIFDQERDSFCVDIGIKIPM